MTLLWLSVAACGGDKTTDNSCQADRNCLTNEKCVNGSCVPASSVNDNKNENKNDNNTNDNNKNENNTNDNNTNDNKNENNTNDNKNDNKNTNDNNNPKEDYPKGPYGADVGDVAIPLALENCDGSVVSKFQDFYKHPKIKVILVTVHTGW